MGLFTNILTITGGVTWIGITGIAVTIVGAYHIHIRPIFLAIEQCKGREDGVYQEHYENGYGEVRYIQVNVRDGGIYSWDVNNTKKKD